MTSPALFKVLDANMHSKNGGSHAWQLNKWYTYKGPLKMCETGFYLTKDPHQWYAPDCRVFIAETKDIQEWKDDKCVCRKARLLAEVPQLLWDEYVKKNQPLLDEYVKKNQLLLDEYEKKDQLLLDELTQKTLAQAHQQ